MKTRKSTENIRRQCFNSCPSERGFVQALLTVLIIIVGIAGAIVFIKYKKQPEKVEQVIQPPLVRIQEISKSDIPIVIHGYGTSKPRVQVDIIPEVAGKVVSVHPELKTGGFIRKDETILQIDKRDYELAVKQAQAAVANAVEQLTRENAEAQVARTEWMNLHGDTEPNSSLVLREPQIRKAKLALTSAEAQLATAELKLERTTISLDFDVLIVSESVDLDQYVVMGQPLARAYGTEALEIIVPLEDRELAWFDAFGNSFITEDKQKSYEKPKVTVRANFVGAERTWEGTVVRTTGQVDPASRMISVVVEVQNPFDVTEGKVPLLPNIFVEVLIHGRTLHNAFAIPRQAVHEGNEIWVVKNGSLKIKSLDILRQDREFVYVTSQVDSKLNLVTSSLDTVVDGMQVRTESNETVKQSEITSEDS